MRHRHLLLLLVAVLLLVAPPSWATSSQNAASPERSVDVRLEFAPVWSLRSGSPLSFCNGGWNQCAGLLSVGVSLLPHLTLEGDVGVEITDGFLYGGMLRCPWTLGALPWLEVSGALGPLVIDGAFGTVYLVHAELAAQIHPIRHVLLFVAAGPDLSFSNQIGPGDDGEHDWRRGEVALRTRIGVGGTW